MSLNVEEFKKIPIVLHNVLWLKIWKCYVYRNVLLSLLLRINIAVMTYHDQKQLRKEGFISLRVPLKKFIIKISEGGNSSKAETWR